MGDEVNRLNRRGFIQGLFGGAVATGLVVTASPADVRAFASQVAPDEPVILDHPTPKQTGVGEHLYNDLGELVAIVTDINVTSDPLIDVTSFGRDYDQYIPGLNRRIDIRAMGVCTFEFEKNKMPYLRGKK